MNFRDIVFTDQNDNLFRFLALTESNDGNVTFVCSTKTNESITVTLNLEEDEIGAPTLIGEMLLQNNTEETTYTAALFAEIICTRVCECEEESEEEEESPFTPEGRERLREVLTPVLQALAKNLKEGVEGQ